MEEFEVTLIWALCLFIIVFVVNYIMLISGYKHTLKKTKKKKKKEIKDLLGMSYLMTKFKLDANKMNLKFVFVWLSIIDALIIACVFVIVYIIPWDIAFRMLLAFVLLFGLIYALYDLLGRYLVKKGWQKDGNK